MATAYRGWLRFLSSVSTALLVSCLAVPAHAQETFQDSFAGPDGPVTGWTVFQGTWEVAGGQLSTVATAQPSWAWAGDPPIRMRGDFRAEVEVSFGAAPALPVGRHGGLMFFANVPTHRNDPLMDGYTIDWIDRVDDHGFRLLRFDDGVQTALAVGTPALVDPPLLWEIEIEGDFIRFFADGAPVFEVEDATYRKGAFGAWAFQNETRLLLDEVEIQYEPLPVQACFTPSVRSGGAPLTVDFDASCSASVEAVDSYQWDFGDGMMANGATVSHEYEFPDIYVVTLTVRDLSGNEDTTTETIEVFEVTADFADDFGRADGPVDGWTPFEGEWQVVNEELTTTTAGLEHWLWAGDPAVRFPRNFSIEFDYEFVAVPADAVGRHGGAMFCASATTNRWDGIISGYTVDWIDRVDDHGVRLIRIDNGVHSLIGQGAAALVDPPTRWRIEIEGDLIRFFGDDVLHVEAVDGAHRGGFFGLWAYSNGQLIAVDNIQTSVPDVSACFTVSPSSVARLGSDLTFDAACSEAPGTRITSWEWDFGDGATGMGEVIEHTYADTGVYRAELTVRTAGGLTAVTEREIEVFEVIDSFEDDFERPDGPPEGWTITSGNWTILSGALFIDTPAAPESWIWAGDPPVRLGDLESVEFELQFLAQPLDAVGRHGGVFLFAQNTLPRFSGNSGYSIDWIDRETDLGYRFSVWNDGVETSLLAGTGDFEPGEIWRIEFEDDAIRLLVDGELKGEVFEGTYRTGHLGFWSYFNGQQIEFDNVLAEGEPVNGHVEFVRGDADSSGAINLTDGVKTLNWLFTGGPEPECVDAADANDSGDVNLTDAVFLFNWLFTGGPAPLEPTPGQGSYAPEDCGADVTADREGGDLGCATLANKCG